MPLTSPRPADTAGPDGPGAAGGWLSGELQAIAAQLWSLATERSVVGGPEPGLPMGAADPRSMLIASAEQEYRERRAREAVFGKDLFGEPAWDMLLYLFAAQLRGDLVLTSSLARASAAPPTTALRWIAQLERAELIERCTIKRDGRVRVQRLTRQATAKLERYFHRRLSTSVADATMVRELDASVALRNG